jgi:RNA polymerase sigma factor (sigma-70 family)
MDEVSRAMHADVSAFWGKPHLAPVASLSSVQCFDHSHGTTKGYAVKVADICFKINIDCDMHAAEIGAPEINKPNPDIGKDIHALVHNYQGFLMGQCRMLTRGNRHDANDLFGRVMLKVCSEGPEQLQQIRHLGGWLSRIAYHQFIDDQRERQASARRDDGLSYLHETIGQASASPEQEYLNNELNLQLQQAFASLPMRLRRVAYMRFYEEAAYEEIATNLHISTTNARKHIQEARKLLGESVRGYVDEAAPPRPDVLDLLPGLQANPRGSQHE